MFKYSCLLQKITVNILAAVIVVVVKCEWSMTTIQLQFSWYIVSII